MPRDSVSYRHIVAKCPPASQYVTAVEQVQPFDAVGNCNRWFAHRYVSETNRTVRLEGFGKESETLIYVYCLLVCLLIHVAREVKLDQEAKNLTSKKIDFGLREGFLFN